MREEGVRGCVREREVCELPHMYQELLLASKYPHTHAESVGKWGKMDAMLLVGQSGIAGVVCGGMAHDRSFLTLILRTVIMCGNTTSLAAESQ